MNASNHSIGRNKRRNSIARLSRACAIEQLEVRRLMTIYNPVALPVTPVEGSTVTNFTVATFASDSSVGNLSASVTWPAGVSTAAMTAGTINGIGTETIPGVGNVEEYSVTTTATFGASTGAGTPQFNASITDSTGTPATSQAFSTVQVLPAPLGIGPVLNASPISTTEGSPITYTDQFSDGYAQSTIADFTATIDWGDGSPQSAATITGPTGGPFSVSGSHTYLNPGSYSVQYSVHDIDGTTLNTTQIASPLVVNVSDATLSSGVIDPVFGTEGQTINHVLLGTFQDGNPDATVADFSASVDWGDGVSNDVGTVALIGGTATSTTFGIYGDHTYTTDSTSPFPVTVSVTDKGGSTVTQTTTATISDPLLIVSGGYQFTAVEGAASATQTVATFVDPGGAESAVNYPAIIDWGDGTQSAGSILEGAGFFSVLGSHTYAEESAASNPGSNPYTITVTLNHVAGIPQTVTSTATVSDPQLTNLVDANLPATGNEGVPIGPVTAIATFTDPGGTEPLTDYNANVNWGDGTISAGTVSSLGGGNFQVDAPAHTYVAEGSFLVTVSVQHEMLPVLTSAGQTINVQDPSVVASAITSPVVTTVTGKSTGTIKLATFTDPGAAAPLADYAASINWGDAIITTGTISESGGVFTVSGAHTYAAAGTYTPLVTISHDTSVPQVVTDTNRIKVTKAAAIASAGKNLAGLEGRVTAGTVATFSVTNTSAISSAFSATITWGDGTSSAGTIVSDGAGHFHVTASHVYPKAFAYFFTVKINEVGGLTGTATGTANISPAPLDELADVSFSQTLNHANLTKVVLGTFRDQDAIESDPTTFSGTINWGDGHSSAATFVLVSSKYNTGSYWKILGTHTYTAKKKFTVTVTFKNLGGPFVNSVITSYITID